MNVDTIIIGGGFAGVTAARELSQLGQKVLLLEARDRLGGRTWTTSFEDYQVELGGTYVHSTQPFVWSELQRYGLHADSVPAEGLKIIFYDGKQSLELDGFEWMGEMMPVFQEYFEPSFVVWPRPYDATANWELLTSLDNKSALDRLNEMELTPMQRITITALIEVCAHNFIQNTSYVEMMRWFALSGHNLPALLESVGTYKIREGTAKLIAAIAGDTNAEIQLSTTVTNIDQNSNGVNITTENGDVFSARHALVTVPMNVVNQIEFDPPLDNVRVDAAKEKHAGEGFKVFLITKGNLGGLWCCSSLADCPLMSISGYHFDDTHSVLVAYGHSLTPVNLEDHEQMQIWMRNYIPDIEIVKSTGHMWNEDALALGTWCTYRPGQMTKYFDALKQDHENVYFAGGDIGDGWRGFIDGAIGSGIMAARRIAS